MRSSWSHARPLSLLLPWILLIALLGSAVLSARADGYAPNPVYPDRVFWGDTHIHTSYSSDAYLFGNTLLDPHQAYRFARGEEVVATNGLKARLRRPLDFVVLADHAEALGLMSYLGDSKPAVMDLPNSRKWRDLLDSIAGQTGAFSRIYREMGNPHLRDREARRSIWHDYVAIADAENRHHEFTTFVGFEWSPTPGGNNLHRVVVFREGRGMADRVIPFAEFDSEDPEDLWRYMDDYHRTTGGDILAIPHNSNGSNGLMFAENAADGRPIDHRYARARSQWEPLIEVTQIKGDSETHPLLYPDDEFADFERWDKGNLLGMQRKDPGMLEFEYARSALGVGLEIAERTGVNPYRFGMIGSTDSHTSLATADDSYFWGGTADNEPGQDRMEKTLITSTVSLDLDVMVWEQAAAGYAGVWAHENTREALFDAMRRREVFATTGPRITLRFFGGWEFQSEDALRPALAEYGYRNGVPMGSDLPSRSSTHAAPSFLIAAMKDPEGANLDRVQVIKGWMDKEGKHREKTIDVAWSGRRSPTPEGKLPAVGNSVDLEQASYLNSIGSVQLTAVWTDQEFDPERRAFYYIRVLEIPTPRWVVYDAVRLGARIPEGAKRIHQERAYSSPIWYVP